MYQSGDLFTKPGINGAFGYENKDNDLSRQSEAKLFELLMKNGAALEDLFNRKIFTDPLALSQQIQLAYKYGNQGPNKIVRHGDYITLQKNPDFVKPMGKKFEIKNKDPKVPINYQKPQISNNPVRVTNTNNGSNAGKSNVSVNTGMNVVTNTEGMSENLVGFYTNLNATKNLDDAEYTRILVNLGEELQKGSITNKEYNLMVKALDNKKANKFKFDPKPPEPTVSGFYEKLDKYKVLTSEAKEELFQEISQLAQNKKISDEEYNNMVNDVYQKDARIRLESKKKREDARESTLRTANDLLEKGLINQEVYDIFRREANHTDKTLTLADVERLYYQKNPPAFKSDKWLYANNRYPIEIFDIRKGAGEIISAQEAKKMLDNGEIEKWYFEKIERINEAIKILDPIWQDIHDNPEGAVGKYNNKKVHDLPVQQDEEFVIKMILDERIKLRDFAKVGPKVNLGINYSVSAGRQGPGRYLYPLYGLQGRVPKTREEAIRFAGLIVYQYEGKDDSVLLLEPSKKYINKEISLEEYQEIITNLFKQYEAREIKKQILDYENADKRLPQNLRNDNFIKHFFQESNTSTTGVTGSGSTNNNTSNVANISQPNTMNSATAASVNSYVSRSMSSSSENKRINNEPLAKKYRGLADYYKGLGNHILAKIYLKKAQSLVS